MQLNYWLFTTYRRKQVDSDLIYASQKYFQGKILDVGGGMSRGRFKRDKKFKWTICDIDPDLKPDVVSPVEKMPFEDNSFDTVKASELFGYVEDWKAGFEECVRVLKQNGYFVCTFPFLTPVDVSQHDSQRISESLIRKTARDLNLKIVELKIEGYFFSVIADFFKAYFQILPFGIRHLTYLLFPILDLLVYFENFPFIKNSRFFKRFPNGYFAVFQKLHMSFPRLRSPHGEKRESMS